MGKMNEEKKSWRNYSVHLDHSEQKIITDDIAAMVAGGATPVTGGAYCKHAALSHARLRKMEVMLRAAARDIDPFGAAARAILESCR